MLELIEQREETLAQLRQLLPTPRGFTPRRRATHTLTLMDDTVAALRIPLWQLLAQLRWAAVRICEAIAHWKETLRKHYSYFGSMQVRLPPP